MIRAALYLVASGAIWFAEGFIFTTFLGFRAWQIGLVVTIYAVLWVAAAIWLIRLGQRQRALAQPLAAWRYLSLAPMLTVIVGSFASLPILLAIAALGKLV